jgi:hypothetical protein
MRNLRLVHSSPRLEYPRTSAQPAARELAMTPLDPDVRALLEHVRIVAPLPRRVRARVLARARAAIAAAAAGVDRPARTNVT